MKILLILTSIVFLAACKKNRVDLLLVIDNSGSMHLSQERVANHANQILQELLDRGADFQIAITTTEAFKGGDYAKFADGLILTPSTENLHEKFQQLVLQGIQGSGDERAFQSAKEALLHPENPRLLRGRSFLKIIVLSDEDDRSKDSMDYRETPLHSVEMYDQFFRSYTKTTERKQRYSFSAIAIVDQQCLDELNDMFQGRKIGERYQQLADMSLGITRSLCEEMEYNLWDIGYVTGNLVELSAD